MTRQTWNRNPSLKAALKAAYEQAPRLAEHPCWCAFTMTWEDTPTCVIGWPATIQKGALNAEALSRLTEFLLAHPRSQWVLWFSSAGADVFDPFASFLALNQLIETLYQLKSQYGARIIGVCQGPMGTYGGASLLLSSCAETIWCNALTDLHLTGA